MVGFRSGVAKMRTESFLLAPHAWVPNHPRLPVVVHSDVRDADGDVMEANGFEALFAHHGWPPQWRDGVYDYHHYHSTAHEVLGVFAGSARLLLGGPGGREVEVHAGDVLVLPAGTGHCCLAERDGFQVVGAYPRGQDWDIQRDAADAATLRRIAQVPDPACDPVTGQAYPVS
jgi:uncharacterized protein YjlB